MDENGPKQTQVYTPRSIISKGGTIVAGVTDRINIGSLKRTNLCDKGMPVHVKGKSIMTINHLRKKVLGGRGRDGYGNRHTMPTRVEEEERLKLNRNKKVHAKHEEKSESKSVYREYNREFLLPKGTNPETIKSSLSKDGVLTVEAPLPALGQPEKLIPIAQN